MIRKPVPKRKAIIGLTSGIGNAILNIPLIEELKSQYDQVDAVFNNRIAFELFQELNLLDNCFLFGRFILNRRLLFYTDYFSDFLTSSRFALHAFLSGAKLSTQLAIGHKPRKTLSWMPNIEWHTMRPNIQKSIEIRKIASEDSWSEEIRLPKIAREIFLDSNNLAMPDYIVIQPCAGDSPTHPKNIDVGLIAFSVNEISRRFPRLDIFLVGGKGEEEAGNLICKQSARCHNLIGKINIRKTVSLIASAKVFMGPDSSLNHLCAAMGVPSFSVWGPSAPSFSGMGYGQYDQSQMIEEFELSLPCRPCLDPIQPNQSRVKSVYECPDLACMKTINKQIFAKQLIEFIDRHKYSTAG